MQKDTYRHFGQGKRENIAFTIDASASVTCHFKNSGDDTNAVKYYNLGVFAKIVMIRNNQLASITHIDGKELKTPITLGTAAANTFSDTLEWGYITIRADVDATTFEIYAG